MENGVFWPSFRALSSTHAVRSTPQFSRHNLRMPEILAMFRNCETMQQRCSAAAGHPIRIKNKGQGNQSPGDHCVTLLVNSVRRLRCQWVSG
jgi:hypothetical protein